MSLGIVALAVIGAALLVRQGLQSDRAARLLRERSHAMARQSEALDVVADEADLFDPSHAEAPEALTRRRLKSRAPSGQASGTLRRGENILRCADSFDSDTSRHTSGSEMDRSEFPQFFAHVDAGTASDIADAAKDLRTAEFHRALMASWGDHSLSIVPMRRGGRVVGVMCLGDPVDMTARAIASGF